MTKLPELPSQYSLKRLEQTAFAGYDRNLGSFDGSIYHMENLCGAEFPLLTVRKRRKNIGRYDNINGLYTYADRLLVAETTHLRLDGRIVGTVSNTEKTFGILGRRVVVFPDKVYLNISAQGVYATLSALQSDVPNPPLNACYAVGTAAPYDLYLWNGSQWQSYEKEFGSLNAAYTGNLEFPATGTLYEETAEHNTIKAEAAVQWSDYFKAGDAVTVSGTVSNNLTAVIREIDGNELRFYENIFATETSANATVARTVPDLDYLCTADNRLWGCKGDEIRCSKLGDPFNFDVFDGISTDSFSVETGTPGVFTGCCCYLGYPTFFKEDKIYKIYGNKPADYTLISAMSRGIAQGAAESIALSGERLYYLSPQGVTVYSGGVPISLQDAFGELEFSEAVGGSDGSCYYLAVTDQRGEHHLFVYDTQRQLWFREDDVAMTHAVCYKGNLCFATAEGDILLAKGEDTDIEGGLEPQLRWFAEFGEFIAASPTKKQVNKILLRLEPQEGAEAAVWISYDGGAYRQCGKTVTGNGEKAVYLPLIPHRCTAFRLKIAGYGPCRIYGLAVEYGLGSPI